MTILPNIWVSRSLLALWLLACVAVLLFAFDARAIHDTDIAFTYLMIFLTFPIGFVFAALVGVIFFALYSAFGIIVPGGFVPNLVTWVFLVGLGYFQWFVVVPWLYRKSRDNLNQSSRGTAKNRRPLSSK